jgi:hypothetical protein
MRLEGYDDRFTLQLLGYLFYPMKKTNVSNVDTVKVADSYNRVAKPAAYIFCAIDYFHGRKKNLQLLSCL